MLKGSEGWSSFWDVATPERAARELINSYGDAAAEAAESCANMARLDDREEDARFWTAALAIVRQRQS